MNKIILTAESELTDEGAREWLQTVHNKLDDVNKRLKTLSRVFREHIKESK